MDLLVAALIGGVVGWVLGRTMRTPTNTGQPPQPTTVDRVNRKLSRRQQRILDTLPADQPRPTLQDLIEQEADELGIPAISTDPQVPLAVRLQVYKRDAANLDVSEPGELEFRVAEGARPPIEASHVRLMQKAEGR